jgi:chaperone modulatory protein CbpM
MPRRPKDQLLAGTIVDETTEISIEQLSVFCSVRRERIVSLVDEGVLEPVARRRSRRPNEWRFAGDSLKRAARAIRLQRELDIDMSALGLVLDLLEEIEALRRRVRTGGRD